MKTNTETGAILQHLNYRDDVVERFDKLAMFLYSISLPERRELLTTLMWQFTFLCKREDLERLDKIYTKMNQWLLVGEKSLTFRFNNIKININN